MRSMAELDRRPFLSVPEAGEALGNPARGLLTFLARGEQTGGALTAFESTAAPGEGPPFHCHVREDELVYVLEGRLRFRLEDAVDEAPSGSAVFIPRGVPHTWQNGGKTRARILAVFTPAAPGMEHFFERAAELPDQTRAADAFETFAGDAGMHVLGPPLAHSRSRERGGRELALSSAPRAGSGGCP
jgi:quercetin dioxygenase-like cupin family protein